MSDAKSTRIELLDPIPADGNRPTVNAIFVKEPSGWQFRKFGDIVILTRLQSGGLSYSDNPETLDLYFAGCIAGDNPRDDLADQLSLPDTMRAREALVDFFTAARAASNERKPAVSGKMKTIELIHPVIGHDIMVREVVLREPTGGEYRQIGEVAVWVEMADGRSMMIENPDAYGAYFDRCVVEQKDKLLLEGQMQLTDAMRMRDAFLGFFSSARAAGSKRGRSSSSGS